MEESVAAIATTRFKIKFPLTVILYAALWYPLKLFHIHYSFRVTGKKHGKIQSVERLDILVLALRL